MIINFSNFTLHLDVSNKMTDAVSCISYRKGKLDCVLPDSRHDFRVPCEPHQLQEEQLLLLYMIHGSNHSVELEE